MSCSFLGASDEYLYLQVLCMAKQVRLCYVHISKILIRRLNRTEITDKIRNETLINTFIRMYAASTEPAIVANPPVHIACSSDLVISLRNGRIINGASLCNISYNKII